MLLLQRLAGLLPWTALDLQEKIASGQTALGASTMTFLKDWISKHIMGTDMEFGKFLNSKGAK